MVEIGPVYIRVKNVNIDQVYNKIKMVAICLVVIRVKQKVDMGFVCTKIKIV